MAQNFPGSEPVIWTDSGLVRFINRGQNTVEFEGKSASVVQAVHLPTGALYTDYFQGRLYVFARAEEAKTSAEPYGFHIMVKEGEGWELVGEVQAKTKQFQNILPLGDGRFLAVTNRPLFRVNGGYSPIGIMKVDAKKKLSPVEGVDLGFSEPMWKDPLDSYGHGVWSYPGMSFSFGLSATFLRVPGYVVVASEDIGYYFIFDDRTGSLKHKAQLFSLLDEERLKHPEGLIPIGLGIQPRPDGHILIASRSEDAADRAAKAFSEPLPKADAGDPAKVRVWAEKTKEIRDLNMKQFPEVQWWDLDPATGTIRPDSAPMNFPDRINDSNQLWNWNWRFKGDGNLLYFNSTKAEGPDATPAKKKWFGLVSVK
jgi:hypothetical protein